MFFRVTQLFQLKDPDMRRLVYVFIKEVRASDDEVFIVTSSLSKDIMESTIESHKANALRLLAHISDPSTN